MVRIGPATPAEKRKSFPLLLAYALRGQMPPSETGFGNDTLAALENVALAYGQPTDHEVAAAWAAFDAEMGNG